MALRSFIRRSISDMFYTFVYETESLQGVGELLEILGRCAKPRLGDAYRHQLTWIRVLQYYQWFRATAQARAPTVPGARAPSIAHGTLTLCLIPCRNNNSLCMLLILLQASNLAMFHQQLAYCTTQFVEKDPQTAETIILALLKYWPVTASSKEVRCSPHEENRESPSANSLSFLYRFYS